MGILIILKDNVKDSLMISHTNKVDDRMTTMMVTSERIIFGVTEVGVVVTEMWSRGRGQWNDQNSDRQQSKDFHNNNRGRGQQGSQGRGQDKDFPQSSLFRPMQGYVPNNIKRTISCKFCSRSFTVELLRL